MRIENGLFNGVDTVRQRSGGNGDDPHKVAQGKDQATVSGKAQIFQTLVNKAKDLSDIVDEEKVKALSQAINNGDYQVDSAKIARKLLGF